MLKKSLPLRNWGGGSYNRVIHFTALQMIKVQIKDQKSKTQKTEVHKRFIISVPLGKLHVYPIVEQNRLMIKRKPRSNFLSHCTF